MPSRAEVLDVPAVELVVELPLPGFAVRPLAEGVALVTYRSVVHGEDAERPQVAHRSSLWVHTDDRWRLAFHQGTPAA